MEAQREQPRPQPQEEEEEEEEAAAAAAVAAPVASSASLSFEERLAALRLAQASDPPPLSVGRGASASSQVAAAAPATAAVAAAPPPLVQPAVIVMPTPAAVVPAAAAAPSVDAQAWARTVAAQRASAPPPLLEPEPEPTEGNASSWGAGWAQAMMGAPLAVAPPAVVQLEPEPEPEPELSTDAWVDHLGATVVVASAPPPVEAPAEVAASAPPPSLVLPAVAAPADTHRALPALVPSAPVLVDAAAAVVDLDTTHDQRESALTQEWAQLRGECVRQHSALRGELAIALQLGSDRVQTRAIDVSSELYLQLKAYYEAARRCDVDRQQAVAEADACDLDATSVWEVSQGKMPMESKCSCGNKVRTTVRFPTATFDPMRAEQLYTRLEGLRSIWFDQLARSMFDSRLCEHSVAMCIQQILCGVVMGADKEPEPEAGLDLAGEKALANMCTAALGTLYYFESSLGHEAVEGAEVPRFRRRVRDWISQVAGRLGRVAKADERCELLRHMLIHDSGGWGQALLQLPPGTQWDGDTVRGCVRLLNELLASAAANEAGVQTLSASGCQGSDSGTYIQMFEQLPWSALFDHAFSDPMRPPSTTEGGTTWYDGEQSTVSLPEPLRAALRTLTFVEHLVEMLSVPLSQFSIDHPDLAKTVAHTLTVVINKVEYYCEAHGARLDTLADQTAGIARVQLRTTVDCLYTRTVACLLCSKNESVWAEGDTLHFRRLSGSGGWAIFGYVFSRRSDDGFSPENACDERTFMAAGFSQPADSVEEWSERQQHAPSLRRDFSEFVSKLGDRGAYYLLSMLANVAIAASSPQARRSFPDERDGHVLAQVILVEMFRIGYVEANTRESLFRVVQKLLPDVVSAAPQLVSQLLRLTMENMRYIGSAAKDLFRSMPVDQWVPDIADFDVLRQMLCEPEESAEHDLGKQICEKMCWGCRQATRTTEPRLAIPATSHRKFALVLLDAVLHHANATAAAQEAAGILDRVYGVNSPVENVVRWSWDRLLDLSLQQPWDGAPWTELQPLLQYSEDPSLQSLRELMRMKHPVAIYAAFELTTVGYDLGAFMEYGIPLLAGLLEEPAATQEKSTHASWSMLLAPQVAISLMRVVVPRVLAHSPESLAPFSHALGVLLGASGGDQSMAASIMSMFGSEPDADIVAELQSIVIGTILRPTSIDWSSVHDADVATTTVQLAWMRQFVGVAGWRTSKHVKGMIGGAVKASLVAGDLPSLVAEIQKSSGAEDFRRQAAGSYDNYVVPKLSAEIAEGCGDAEYATLARLLAHTQAEAGNRQVLGSQLAQLYGTDRSLKAAAEGMQLSKTRIASLDNFAVHNWAAATMEMDALNPILPLYYQVFLCLFFQVFKDVRQEALYMGHRFLSEDVIAKLQSKLDADASVVLAAGRSKVGEFFNSARDWVSRGTTDAGCIRLFEDQRESGSELIGVAVEQPWDKPGLLWMHMVDLSELRASLSENAWQPKAPSLPAEPVRAVPVRLDPVPMFCRPQPMGELSLEPAVPSLWPLHSPSWLFGEVSEAITSVQQSHAQYRSHNDEITALDLDIEGLLPQLYENRQVEKIERAECSKLQRGWNDCKGGARFSVKVNAVRKRDFMWKQLGGNRQRWRAALSAFDVDTACVQSVARARKTFERSVHIPIVPVTDPRNAARGTDTLLNRLLPGLLDPTRPTLSGFAPARAMLTCAVPLCTTAYVHHSVAEMERVLLSMLEHPHFIPHLAEHFDPFVCCHDEASASDHSRFVAMYGATLKALDSQQVDAGLIMMLVQKFDMNEWLGRAPDGPACALMISTCAESLEQLHSVHGPQDLLWGNGTLDLNTSSVMEHEFHALRKTAQFRWPAQFDALLGELLTGRLASVAPNLAEPTGLSFAELPLPTIEQAVATCARSFDDPRGSRSLYADTRAVQRLQSVSSWIRAMLASPQATEVGEWSWRMMWELYKPWLSLQPQDTWLWDIDSDVARASAGAVLEDFARFVLQLCDTLPKISLLNCWEWLHGLLRSDGPAPLPLPPRGVGLICASLSKLPWRLFPANRLETALLPGILQTLEGPSARLGPSDGAVVNFCTFFYGQVLSAVEWSQHGCSCQLLATMLTVVRMHQLPLPKELIAACEACALHPDWKQLRTEDWTGAARRFSAVPAAVAAGANLESERYRLAIGLVRAAADLALPQDGGDVSDAVAFRRWEGRAQAYIVYRYESCVAEGGPSSEVNNELVSVSAEMASLLKELLAADGGAVGPPQQSAGRILEVLLHWHSCVPSGDARQRLRAVVADTIVIHAQQHTALLFLRHVLNAAAAAGAPSWDDCSFLADLCITLHLSLSDASSWLDVVETCGSALAGDADARTGLERSALSEKRGLVAHAIDALQETIDMESVAAGGGEAEWFNTKEGKRQEQQQLGDRDQALAPGTRLVVEGYGEGIYIEWTQRLVGANTHAIHFDTGGRQEVQLKPLAGKWQVL